MATPTHDTPTHDTPTGTIFFYAHVPPRHLTPTSVQNLRVHTSL